MNLGLGDKVALISGASRGIGRAIAEKLAREGCDLMIVARTSGDLERARDEIAAASGRRVAICVADLSARAGIDAAVAALNDSYSRLDVLVNNVGGMPHGHFLELDNDDWHRGFEVKVFGYMRMCRALWPLLKASRGAVINISGNFAVTPSHNFMIAGATGAALMNVSKALANLGLIDDVNVNVVQPGGTVTGQLKRLLESQADAEGLTVAEVKKRNAGVTGIRRYAETNDVADLVAFLASPRARHLQGTVAVVDGGATKRI
ncbi:MAG: SDR family oxidoreductase [Rhodospirillales bacterium]|jgi:3-oxoacyl-[acyl-carrier protein] reductase|nr:SDR family oxidoreductase [Rhodospirillales bacterium]